MRGFRKWAPKSQSQLDLFFSHADLFLKTGFTPLVYVQNDQRGMGIILRYIPEGTHRTPPPPAAPSQSPRRHSKQAASGAHGGGGGGWKMGSKVPLPLNPIFPVPCTERGELGGWRDGGNLVHRVGDAGGQRCPLPAVHHFEGAR